MFLIDPDCIECGKVVKTILSFNTLCGERFKRFSNLLLNFCKKAEFNN